MELKSLFLIALLLSITLFLISSMLIVYSLRRMGMSISCPSIRFLSPIYAFRYRQIQLKRLGSNGWLFHLWVISLNLSLVCFVIYLFSD